MATPFPVNLQKLCWRCKQRITDEIGRTVIVNGYQVRMHEDCAVAWENEEEEPYGSEEQIAA